MILQDFSVIFFEMFYVSSVTFYRENNAIIKCNFWGIKRYIEIDNQKNVEMR